MVEWNTFDYSFEYSFDFGFDFDYSNIKGPHKQPLIVNCFVTFKIIKILEF